MFTARTMLYQVVNRRCVILFIIFVIYLPTSENAAAIFLNQTHPDHPGKCYYDGIVIRPGYTKRHPSRCNMLKCREDFSLYFAECGLEIIEPPCKKIPGDLSKPYPYCCSDIRC